MNSWPVRLFHAMVLGLVLGTLLSMGTLQIMPSLAASPAPGGGSGGGETPPPPDSGPANNSPPVDPNDRDGDEIPNIWEARFHHDPDAAADAGSDFDNDGLTALQEYRLSLQSNGSAGNPLGIWSSEAFPTPPEYAGGTFYPVDINDNGDVLVNGSVDQGGTSHTLA
ncbi:MAG: hypothetical protein Q8Q59_15545, partial [Luteolibacter sp.]|nr:hypothetical protein [Luteolibacter sp.]